MGRRDRERVERIKAGLEKPLRAVLARSVQHNVVRELQAAPTGEQIGVLNRTAVTPKGSSALRKAIEKKAPGEMDKAIAKYQREGREITVDSLLVEVRSEPGFLKMCEGVGLNYGWFERLAEERMRTRGVIA